MVVDISFVRAGDYLLMAAQEGMIGFRVTRLNLPGSLDSPLNTLYLASSPVFPALCVWELPGRLSDP